MAKHRVLTTDDDIEKAAAESASLPSEPRVVGIRSDEAEGQKLLVLLMDNESRHSIPTAKLEGLRGVSDQVLLKVEISEDGLGLRWPELDLDLYVPALLHGIYGTEKWMARLGQSGGRVRSEAKGRAARENGRKGGRPRKATASATAL